MSQTQGMPLQSIFQSLLNPAPSVQSLLVCGGRDFDDKGLLYATLTRIWREIRQNGVKVILVHGGARGADRLAGQWAEEMGVPCIVHAADWDRYGRSAGIIRNIEMFDKWKPSAVVAFKGGKGTAHMVGYARKKGANVLEI